MTKRKHLLAAEPNPFRVSTSYERGVNGDVVSIQVHERIEGTENEGLACSFVADLRSVPALKAQLDCVFDHATRDGLFNYSEDDQGGDRD
jgi:hypothetical protein